MSSGVGGQGQVSASQTSWRREVTPRLPVHLAQVVVDGGRAEEQAPGDLAVGRTGSREAGDLRLLRGQRDVGRHVAAAAPLARGRQLAPGPLGERTGAHGLEQLVGGPQLLARLRPSLAAAEPLAVQQLGPGQRHPAAGAGDPGDRFVVQRLGVVPVGQQGLAPGGQAERQRRVVGRGPAAHLLGDGLGDDAVAGAHRRLEQVGEGRDAEEGVVPVRREQAGVRGFVVAEPELEDAEGVVDVVQHPAQPALPRDRGDAPGLGPGPHLVARPRQHDQTADVGGLAHRFEELGALGPVGLRHGQRSPVGLGHADEQQGLGQGGGRALLARQALEPRRQPVERLVVADRARRPGGGGEPPQHVARRRDVGRRPGRGPLSPRPFGPGGGEDVDDADRLAQQRRRGLVPGDGEGGFGLEEEIARRALGSRRCQHGERSPGDVAHRPVGWGEGARQPGRGQRREHGLPGQAGIDRLEGPGRIEQQPGARGGRARRLAHEAVQPIGERPVDRVVQLGSEPYEHRLRPGRRAGRDVVLGGRNRPADPVDRVGAELSRPEAHGGRQRAAAPGHRLVGEGVELGGQGLIGAPGRGREVPGPPDPVAVELGAGRQGLVRAAPLFARRAPVHGRAHERVAEADRRLQHEQPARGDHVGGVGSGAQRLGGGQDRPRLGRRVGRGDQQQDLARSGEHPHVAEEVRLELGPERERLGEGRVPGQLVHRQAGGDLHDGEGRPTRVAHDPPGDLGGDHAGRRLDQQGARLGTGKALDAPVRQPRQLAVDLGVVAAAASSESVARPRRNRSAGAPATRPKAEPSALRWRSGRSARWARSGRSRRWRAA